MVMLLHPSRACGALCRLLATALEPYSAGSINLLDYLGHCSDSALLAVIVATRLALLLFMWGSREVAPAIFGAPDNSFVFDTGELLYADARLSMVSNWDGVHMFSIAQHGYLYESQIVFFPGLPAIIRGLDLVTRRLVPVLHRIAPVAAYVCAVNVAASGLAGVLLRRLTILTFLGPEAVRSTCRWRSAVASSRSSLARHAAAEATTHYRLLCGMTGTVLDAPDVHAPLPSTAAQARAAARQRRRVVGGATLVWVLTPAMVFTVVVYTESLYALATILGVYLLAWHEPLPLAVQQRIASHLASAPPATATTTAGAAAAADITQLVPLAQQWVVAAAAAAAEAAERGTPDIVSLVREATPGAATCPLQVVWEQRLITGTEAAAVLLFTVAGAFRSNAFTCAGFLIFPLCVQAALPSTHAAQSSAVLAGVSAHRVLAAATASRGSRVDGRLVVRCPTVHPPLQRVPHPLRLLVVALECACLTAPYLAMNYLGYRRFVLRMWDAASAARMGRAFWTLYPTLQERYWGVQLFSAYTFTNMPNVVLALPVAVLTAWCISRVYLSPALANARAAAHRPRTRWQRVCAAVTPYVRSSNVVHLTALLTLALTAMHVQVTNRFVMASPALCWLLGGQLAAQPRSVASQLILLWSAVWIVAGGILFPNHLPWT